ncbi:MAG: hypothetical protein RIS53_349 [Bacillota bacterium]
MFAQVFGEKHLVGTGLLLTLVFIFLISIKRNANLKTQKKYLFIFTTLFLSVEFIRLILLVNRDGTLAIYQLPLNLCSVPLYLYPALVMDRKNASIKNWLMPAAFSTVMLAGLIALLIPTNILGVEQFWLPLENNLVEITSFIFHGLMIAAPLALIKLGYYKPKIKDIPKALLFTGVFTSVAMIVNTFTNQDFLLLNYGNGSPFQFLINISKLLYQLTMISLGAFLISLFFVVGEAIQKNSIKS